MTLVLSGRSSLIGGVSQQPEDVRLESQCEKQDNAYSSVINGLMKRPPTQFLSLLLEGTEALGTEEDVKTHFVNISPTERYVFLFGSSSSFSSVTPVRIWDANDGTEMDVTGDAGGAITVLAKGYVQRGANLDTHRFLTLRDTTFLLNTGFTALKDTSQKHDAVDVDTGTAEDFRSKSNRRVFYFIRATNHYRKYEVRLVLDQGGTAVPANTTADDRFENTAWVKVFSGMHGMGAIGTAEDVPPYDTGAGEYAGKMIPYIGAKEVAERLYRENQDPQPIGATLRDKFYNGGLFFTFNRESGGFTLSDYITTIDESGAGGPNIPPMGGSVVMLQARYDDKNHTSGWFIDGIDLEIVQDDSGSARDLIVFKDSTEEVSDLPLWCLPGHVVKITGVPDSDADEYYVEFVAEADSSADDNIVQGYWKESMASLTEFAIDASTMPHQIVRVVDGTAPNGFRFEVKVIDWTDKTVGDTDSNPDPSFIDDTIRDIFFFQNRLGFISGRNLILSESGEFFNFYRTTVQVVKDSDRIDIEVGGRDGNLAESAVVQADSLIVFSGRTQSVVEGNPTLTPSSVTVRQVSEYDSFTSFKPVPSESGLLFGYPGAAGQFSQIREFRRVGDGQRYGHFEVTAQVPQYIVGTLTELAVNTVDNILVARGDLTSDANTLYVYKWFDSGEERLLSAWQRWTFGPGEDGDFATKRMMVLGIGFFDSDLYMVNLYESANVASPAQLRQQIVLERLRVADHYGDPFPFDGSDPTNRGEATSDYVALLDRRVTEEDCTIAYDYTNQQVIIDLPYKVARDSTTTTGQAETVVVTRVNSNTGGSAAAKAEGRVIPIASIGVASATKTRLRIDDPIVQSIGPVLFNELGSAGDRETRLFIGQGYEMDYQFSRFQLREQQPDGSRRRAATGRYQLKYGSIAYEDTVFFQVHVDPETRADGVTPIISRDSHVHTEGQLKVGIEEFQLERVNMRRGVARFPVFSDPRLVKISIKNPSPFPSNLTSAELEATFSRRATPARG